MDTATPVSSESPPCAVDPTSVVGLGAFVRAHPGGWDALLRLGAPQIPDAVAILEMTVERFLKVGLPAPLLPRHLGDEKRLRRDRACARRLVEFVGDTPMADVDDEFLAELHSRISAGGDIRLGKLLAAESASRTVGLLRAAARRWAQLAGVVSRVGHTTSKRAPAPHRAPSRFARPMEVVELLRGASAVDRAILGLAFGCGLRESEIRHLRYGDLRFWDSPRPTAANPRPGWPPPPPPPPLREWFIVLRPGGLPQASAYSGHLVILPQWVLDLLAGAKLVPAQHATVDHVFPGRKGPSTPRTSLASVLSRPSKSLVDTQSPPFTLGDLRRGWQQLARSLGLPREVVRQSWATGVLAGGQFQSHPAIPVLRKFAATWVTLNAPMTQFLARSGVFPRRAPGGRRRDESELPRVPPAPPPLPQSCLY